FADKLKIFRGLGLRHVRPAFNPEFCADVASKLMIWKCLGLLTDAEPPTVVVLSGSMEPAFYRGDQSFLVNPPDTRHQTGDITVHKITGHDILIVRRELETHDVVKAANRCARALFLSYVRALTDDVCVCRVPRLENHPLLTKCDNNYLDDVELYRGLDASMSSGRFAASSPMSDTSPSP
ncbi:hypothetical protein BC834DRAFT_999084, partial [Gloeopeniophorella convolvens]